MKLFTKKPHSKEKEEPKQPISQEKTAEKPVIHTKRTISFKRVAFAISRTFAALIPLAIIFGGIPALLVMGSSVAQPFFKAANFTITGSVNAFSSLEKRATLSMDANGFTNILIVGIDTRSGNKGGTLLNTDTIILASYNNKTNEVAMVSFPRDLDVTYPNSSSYGKINATYAYGERRQAGSGMEYLRQEIEIMTGKKIQYHVQVDLKGFTTIIDQLGGVDIDVAPGFTGWYPTEYYAWISVNFARGMNHMDGNRALQYARIRHVYKADTYADYVAEASDFGRARRQQKIIQAVIDKATKTDSLKNTKTIFNILGTVAENIKINQITPSDVEAGLAILQEKGKPVTYSMVLDPSSGGGKLIMRDPETALYELRPRAGRSNWSAVKNYLNTYFATPLLVQTSQTIVVYNNNNADFNNKFNSLKSAVGNAKYSNKGTVANLPAPGVYNVGGKQYEGTSLYIANIVHLPYVAVADPKTFTPQQSEGNIVVVF